KRMFDNRGFHNWSDITGSAVDHYLIKRKQDGVGKCTCNRDLQVIKQFCNWIVQEGRAVASPIGHLKKERMLSDDRIVVRRILEVDELRSLLRITATQPTRFGLTGYERSLLYRLAAETGIRAGAFWKLKVKNINFESCQIKVLDIDSKGKKTRYQRLRKNTALELQQYLANKLPEARAFPFWKDRGADMLRADLEAAKIPFEVDGERFDFHALRHEHGSLLDAQKNVDDSTLQKSMGHSSFQTTKVYIHKFKEEEIKAVEALPDLTLPDERSRQQAGTGTDTNQ
ncbi:tyrosine-type recombinase/integrase, partial [Planctomycetota bacterium]